uniref:Tc1-like transposase DDE domain-containing protein n=1 Tax=Esox lucius TaxID=8010 RepID=A0AAY5KHH0_ESOLU
MGLNECVWHGQPTHLERADSYFQVLEQHMLPSRRCLFQGSPCIFQHDNARPHTASITMSWLHRRRIRLLKWPACTPDLSPIENIWRIIKRKVRQSKPKTVATRSLY